MGKILSFDTYNGRKHSLNACVGTSAEVSSFERFLRSIRVFLISGHLQLSELTL